MPISDIGECDRDGEIRLTGIRPSSVSCFTTLVLKIFQSDKKIFERNYKVVSKIGNKNDFDEMHREMKVNYVDINFVRSFSL